MDSLKFAGGCFSLMPRSALREIIDIAHRFDVSVSTGSFLEYVLKQGTNAINQYIKECRAIGFDIIEISTGFISLPVDDWLRLVEKVQKARFC